MCVGSVIVYHGLVFVGHGDILVGEGPAVGFDHGLCGMGSGVGVEVVGVWEVGDLDGVAVVGTEFKGDVVDVVAAEVLGYTGGEDVSESDVAAVAGVALKADGGQHRSGGAGVVDGGDRHEGGGVVEVGHDADLELVLCDALLDVHGELEGADVAVELGHGVDAALVEEERVGAGVCVGSVIVYHGLVLVGHGDILVGEGPAGRLDAGLGGGGRGVGVEVLGVGEVGDRDAGARCGTVVEHQVVDVVDAVVASLAGGEDVAEGDVATGPCVGGEVDGDMLVVGAAVVDGGDGRVITTVIIAYPHLHLVLGLGLLEVEVQLQGVYFDV